jgi:membrane associated rhomboid family serine protease
VTTIPPVTAALLAINIGLYVIAVYLWHPLFASLEQYNAAVYAGEWWRLVTGAFLHLNLIHIGFNMYALYLFGPQIERQTGSLAFAALYGASLLWGSVAYLILVPAGAAVGASGAIFGLFGAWIVASYKIRHTPHGRRLWQQLIALLVLNLALGFWLRGIAWQAHLGGLAAGMLVVFTWQKLGVRSRSAATRVWVAVGVAMVAVVVGALAILAA